MAKKVDSVPKAEVAETRRYSADDFSLVTNFCREQPRQRRAREWLSRSTQCQSRVPSTAATQGRLGFTASIGPGDSEEHDPPFTLSIARDEPPSLAKLNAAPQLWGIRSRDKVRWWEFMVVCAWAGGP
jgi:hypothetical protein